MFYFPLIRHWSEKYHLEKELAADQHSISQSGLKPLVSALLKILERSSLVSSIHGSAGFSPEWMDKRIHGLLTSPPALKGTICPVYDLIK